MSRGTKVFLAAIIAAIFGVNLGFVVTGMGEHQYVTPNGIVNYLDAYGERQLSKNNPEYAEILSWGGYSLDAIWYLYLPLLLAICAAAITILLMRLVKRSVKGQGDT